MHPGLRDGGRRCRREVLRDSVRLGELVPQLVAQLHEFELFGFEHVYLIRVAGHLRAEGLEFDVLAGFELLLFQPGNEKQWGPTGLRDKTSLRKKCFRYCTS